MISASDFSLMYKEQTASRGHHICLVKAVNSNGTVDVELPEYQEVVEETAASVNIPAARLFGVPVVNIGHVLTKPVVGGYCLVLFSTFPTNKETMGDSSFNPVSGLGNCIAIPITVPANSADVHPDYDTYIIGKTGVDVIIGNLTKAAFVALAPKVNTAFSIISSKITEITTQVNALIASTTTTPVTTMASLSDVSSENTKVS
jgi:hypothetical protein